MVCQNGDPTGLSAHRPFFAGSTCILAHSGKTPKFRLGWILRAELQTSLPKLISKVHGRNVGFGLRKPRCSILAADSDLASPLSMPDAWSGQVVGFEEPGLPSVDPETEIKSISTFMSSCFPCS